MSFQVNIENSHKHAVSIVFVTLTPCDWWCWQLRCCVGQHVPWKAREAAGPLARRRRHKARQNYSMSTHPAAVFLLHTRNRVSV